jgi:hypothetical protein
MADAEEDLQQLEAMFDEELKTIVEPKEEQLAQPPVISYEELLRLKGAYERIIQQQMDLIRFMGDAAAKAGIDFRDYQE